MSKIANFTMKREGEREREFMGFFLTQTSGLITFQYKKAVPGKAGGVGRGVL